MSTHRVVGFSVYVPAGFPSGVGGQLSSWLIFSQLWQFDGGMPITIEAARRVGKILKYLELDDFVGHQYSYYM